MFRTSALSVTAAVILVLLCANSPAQDVGVENICSADDPTAGLQSASFYRLVQNDSVWKPTDGLSGSTKYNIKIGVYFLDGMADQQSRVRQYAQEWIDRSKIPIEWVFGDSTVPIEQVFGGHHHIRVTFKGPANNSLYGNRVEGVHNNKEATMHLGVFNNGIDPVRIRRTVLHEFGHALGLMHEHLNPNAKLNWDKDRIVSDMMMENVHWCWDNDDNKLSEEACTKKVEKEITIPVTGKEHACAGDLTYDPKSIMHYGIWKGWLKNNPDPIPAPTDLSKGDLDCVSKLYGAAEPPVPIPPKPKTPGLTQETCSVSSERFGEEIKCRGRCSYPGQDRTYVASRNWSCGGYAGGDACVLHCAYPRQPVAECGRGVGSTSASCSVSTTHWEPGPHRPRLPRLPDWPHWPRLPPWPDWPPWPDCFLCSE